MIVTPPPLPPASHGQAASTATPGRKGIGWRLGSLLTLVYMLGVVATVGGAYWYLQGRFRYSIPYRESLRVVAGSPIAQNLLGEPITMDGWIHGKFVRPDVDSAPDAILILRFDVEGRIAVGRVVTIAEERDGAWTYRQLALRYEGMAEPIDLLAPADGMGSSVQ